MQKAQICISITTINITETQYHFTTKQLSSLRHFREIIICVKNRMKSEKVKSKSTEQILCTIKIKSSVHYKTIVSVYCLLSKT